MPVTNIKQVDRNKDRAEVIEKWAQSVITRWEEEIATQEIKNPDALLKSLYKRVYNASGGNQTKIVFTLLNYGRFADLGVGRGEKYSRDKHAPIFRTGQKYPETKGYRWQVKHWFLPVFKQRVYSLGAILERKYNEYAELMFFQNFEPEEFLK